MNQDSLDLLAALARFGVPLAALGVSRDDLLRENEVLQVGLPSRRIDILTSISGVSFDEAYPDHLTLDISGLSVPFIGRAALVRNKRASGHTKDLADLEALGQR